MAAPRRQRTLSGRRGGGAALGCQWQRRGGGARFWGSRWQPGSGQLAHHLPRLSASACASIPRKDVHRLPLIPLMCRLLPVTHQAITTPPPVLQDKERLYLELKSILARQPGPEAAEQLNLYQVGPRPWAAAHVHSSGCTAPHRMCTAGRCSVPPHLLPAASSRHLKVLLPLLLGIACGTAANTLPLPRTAPPAGQPAGEEQADEGAGLGAQHVPSAGTLPLLLWGWRCWGGDAGVAVAALQRYPQERYRA